MSPRVAQACSLCYEPDIGPPPPPIAIIITTSSSSSATSINSSTTTTNFRGDSNTERKNMYMNMYINMIYRNMSISMMISTSRNGIGNLSIARCASASNRTWNNYELGFCDEKRLLARLIF